MSLFPLNQSAGPSGFGYRSTAEEVTDGLDLSGKTYLVTGCSTGLGRETLRVLTLRGARVIALARTLENALWIPLDPFGTPWDPCGPLETSWDPFGPLGTPLDPFGPLLTPWAPWGPLWTPWDPLGSPISLKKGDPHRRFRLFSNLGSSGLSEGNFCYFDPPKPPFWTNFWWSFDIC